MKKILLCILVVTFSVLQSNIATGQSNGFNYGFDSLSSGMTSPGAYVLALAMKDSAEFSNVYAGGHFTIAGRDTEINIAQWVDSTDSYIQGKWEPMGKGVNGDVCALQMCNKYLFAGGKFDTAGGIAASHIARWDTAALKWDSLVGKLNGNVYALCVYNNNLYVGGDFTIADGDTVNRIAVWKDSLWASVGKGFDTGAVYALTVSNDTLYAGGSFLKSNGIMLNHIAKLKGNTWDSLGSGTNNTVYALEDYYALFVGGAFTESGGINTSYISFYDNYFNRGWSSVGSGVNDTVRALNAGSAEFTSIIEKKAGQGIGGGFVLLVGGDFDSADGYRCHYLAEWQEGWDTLGELNGPVFALANSYNTRVGNNYVGGKFDAAYAPSSVLTLNHVACLSILLGNGGIQSISDNSNIDIYPNPSSGVFTIQAKSEELIAKSNVEVYNMLGEKVYSNPFNIQNQTFNIDLSSQPNGIYLYRVLSETGSLVGEGKLVIQK